MEHEEPKAKFYYEGTFYANEEAFWEGIYKFCSDPLEEKSFESLFQAFITNLKMNLCISKPTITNQEFRKRLDQAFIICLEVILKDGE
jgi:hypothetical protein